MITVEKIECYGWESAIRGMRNPMNSWDKSDSISCVEGINEDCGMVDSDEYLEPVICHNGAWRYCVGQNDFKLMKKLSSAGSDHGKFMRMINVTMDINAPLYWWKEFDTYKVGTVANSCSTMHKIHDKEFTLDDFSCEHLMHNGATMTMNIIVNDLNTSRRRYLETRDKRWWWQMIQLLPSSYNQKRTVQLNYAVLRNIYHSRRNHKLDEWHTFCEWIEALPYSELITM